jgi:tetratricopeptide (TPR) repeat protein
MGADDLDDAAKTLEEAKAKHLDGSMTSQWYELAFLRGDDTEMARLVKDSAGKPGDEDALLSSQADTEAFGGRIREARSLSRLAVESALRSGDKVDAAGWQADLALREAEMGDPEEAVRAATAALKLAETKTLRIAAATAWARCGEAKRAEHAAAALERDFPEDTLLKNYWLPVVRASIALKEKQPGRAIAALQVAGPYELGGATPPFSGAGATLDPVFLAGEAYLAGRQWGAAVAEFSKIKDHRGLVWNSPFGALAWLGLGRAYAGEGDRTRSIAAYGKFLSLWHDADPDLAIFRQAKSEYARLQPGK